VDPGGQRKCVDVRRVYRFRAFLVMLLLTSASFSRAIDELPAQGASMAPSAQLPYEASTSPLGQDHVALKAESRYKVQVSIDEVRLTFHAVDSSGKPVNDLKPSDLDLFDNESGPGRIVALQRLQERPLSIAFLVDTSGSVSRGVRRSRAYAVEAAQTLMQSKGDYGLAIGFARTRDIVQPWSHDLNTVTAGIRRIGATAGASLDGTSLFDSLFSTCFYEFRAQQDVAQNVLFLFSDGIDTSSHATLEQAVGACQQTHTSIFIFTSTPAVSDLSIGIRALRKLSEQTGGSIIHCDRSDAEVGHTIEALATDIRNEYQLFYRPKNLKRDGSFHRIILVGPSRVAAIIGQSGYYALSL
jgi:Ca-activated chloride channel homolog